MKYSSSFLKKFGAALFALIALAFPSQAVVNGGNYTLTTNSTGGGNASITGYTGNLTENLVIPLKDDAGLNITQISPSAFAGASAIFTLTLPTSLTTIGANAFRNCNNLGSVFIPASVTSIGTGAFAACDRLASIEVDSSNPNYISQDGVLYDLATSAPDAILLQYPAGRLGNSYSIPATLATTEPVISVAASAFEEAQNLLSMEFENSVATIGANAFDGAPRLSRVTFDTQVTTIGASSFNGTSSLAFATFLGNAPTTFGTTVFAGASAGFEVRYVQGATGFTAPTWTPLAGQTYNSRTIQTTVPLPGEAALTYRVVGSGVEILSPEPGVFATIQIPDTIAGLPVRSIGNAAFIGSSIAVTTLPNSLNTIGTKAFEGSALTFVEIPAGVSSIGTGAFAGCSNLVAFIVNPFNQNYSSDGGVLFDKNKKTLIAYPLGAPASSYTLPSTVETVAQRAFEGNANLVSVIFPDSVVTIQDRAFYNSAQLVWAYFGIKVNSIGAEAFSGTNSVLNNVYFFGGAPTVGTNAFPQGQQPFEVLYLEGATGFTSPTWTPSIGQAYTAKPFEKFDDFTFTVLDNNTVEITGYTGTPPSSGGVPDVRIDFTTLPPAQRVVTTQAQRLGLGPTAVDLGEYVLQSNTQTLYVVSKVTPPSGNSTGKVDWAVVKTDGEQLKIDTNLALGSTVLVQDDVGPIVWQKVAYPGSNASDWISVNFGLPDTIAGKPVTSIGENAFAGNANMVSAVLPTSLTKIGVNAFKGCSALGTLLSSYRGIFIPASVITIGEGAFADCEYLDNIFVHPNSANYSSLDGVLFNKDQSILHSFPTGRPRVTYEIPATVTTIANQAFEGNQWVVALTLSDSVKTIGDRAFANAQSLVQITIGKGIEDIGDEAFKDALVLGSAVFTGNAPDPDKIGSQMFDGTADPFEIEYFSGYTGFSPKPAAWSTYTLSSLLTSGDFVFTTTNGTATITGYVGTGGAVTIPSKFGQLAVRKIGKEAFLGKQGITSVRIPDSVSSIDEGAFKGVSTLASVTFGSGLTEIGKEAFYGCNEMTEVSISAAVTSIGEAAFAACEKLIAIRVNPNNSRYRSAQYLNGAGEVLIDRAHPDPAKEEEILWQYPAGIQQSTYEIPTSVKTIGTRAFEGAMYLSVIEFPDNVKTIEPRAFYNTSALVTVRFGRGIKTIENEAFAGIITPLNAAIFYGAAPTTFGTNVFQGALPTFKVRYLAGAADFPATGANWTGYIQVPISEVSDFEIQVLSNNTIEIIGYTGLAPEITADLSTLPTPKIVVPDRAARLALTDVNTAINTRLPENTLVLQQDEDLIYKVNFTSGLPIWSVYNNAGARFSLAEATALGTVVLEQDGVSKVYYQKVTNPGAVASNWIVVDFRIPNTLSGLQVTSIAARAFEDNTVINSVVLPSTLTKIGAKAFSGCTNLGGLVSGATEGGLFIPASVTDYGAGAFASCSLLQQIIAHPLNPAYASQAGVLFNKRSTKLVQFPSGLARNVYEFPQSVTEIAPSAFAGNLYLAEIEIPNSITTIGTEAFAGCATLIKAIFLGYTAPSLGSNAFSGVGSGFEIQYFEGATGFNVSPWTSFVASILPPTTTTGFTYEVNGGTVKITGFTGTDLAGTIQEYQNVPGQSPNYVVPTAEARLDLWWQFYRQNSQGIPNGTIVLQTNTNTLYEKVSGDGFFESDWQLLSAQGSLLDLNPNLPLGTVAFVGASNSFYQKILDTKTAENNWIKVNFQIPSQIDGKPVVAIAEGAFEGNSNITSVALPSSLTQIGSKAFYKTNFDGKVFIPSGVKTIGTQAFAQAGQLFTEFVVHPDNLNFMSLEGVLFSKNLKYLIQYPAGRYESSYAITAQGVREYAFEKVKNLVSIDFADSVETLEPHAFYGMADLAQVTFGKNIVTIGTEAFAGCATLIKAIFLGYTAPNLGSNAFSGVGSGFEIQYFEGATGFNVSPWTSFVASILPPTTTTGFTYEVNGGTVKITGFTGTDLAGTIQEYQNVPGQSPNYVVPTAEARLDLWWQFYRQNSQGIPNGTIVLQTDTNTLYEKVSGEGFFESDWQQLSAQGSLSDLNPNLPLGVVAFVGASNSFYQKILDTGAAENNWIKVNFQIPSQIDGKPVVAIAEGAFEGNSNITSVALPNSITKIESKAFYKTNFSGKVFIPSGVKTIGAQAFANAGQLFTEFVVHPDNTAFGASSGVLCSKDQKTLYQYPAGRLGMSYEIPAIVNLVSAYSFEGNMNLVSVQIPDGVTSIANGAFYRSNSLIQVMIGSGVKKIGDLAFADISSLESITFKGNAPGLLGANVFQNLPSSSKIQFNARSTGFNVAPWASLNLVPVWMSEGSPTSAGFRAFGYVDPAAFNNNIGGQFQISVSRSRVATGVLVLGAAQTSRIGFSTSSTSISAGGVVSYRFRGLMDDTGGISVSIPRRGQTDLELDLQFDLLEAPVFFKLSGNSSVTDGTSTANVTAGMIPWSSANPANAYAGNYNMAFIANAGTQTISPGQGFAGMGVEARTGAARLTGVLGDGTRFTGASWVLGDGMVPFWFPLYSNRGMLVGDVDLGANGSNLSTNLLWTKPPGVPRSPDPNGFDDVILTAATGSGRYVAPSLSSFNNMVLNFLGEPAADLDFDQTFTVLNGRIVPGASNPYLLQAAWNLRGGLVQGTFSQPDPIQPLGATRPLNRVGRFQGVILTNGEIHGNFVLPNSATRPTEFYGGSVQK